MKHKLFTYKYFWLYFTIVLAGVPLLRSMYVLHMMIMSFIYIIFCSSWDLISGVAGQITFGHAGLFATGAYTSAILSLRYGVSPWIGVLIGRMIVATLGLVIGFPSLRLKVTFLPFRP